MTVMDELASVKSFFQSHQVHLSAVWLESCINWCKEENIPPNYTLKDLQMKVYEQWLLLDLRDMELPCLPPNISSKKLYILNGIFSLQMMHMIDISKPKHWQLQRIRNGIPKNVEQEGELGKRVLQLTLTDGVQEVEAMEFKPIPSLNINLAPGIKLRLMGPISVRRGRLLLESHNIKILGGEVEDLIISNAAENVLAKHLKLPINPKPKIIEESLLTANKDMFNETDARVNRTVFSNQNIQGSRLNQQPISKNNNQNQQIVTVNSVSNHTSIISKAAKEYKNNSTINEEEELRIAAEIDMLMEIENEFEQSHVKEKTVNKSPDLFEDMDIDDEIFNKIVIPDDLINNCKETKKVSTVNDNLNNDQQHLIITASSNCDNLNNTEQKLNISNNLDLSKDGCDDFVDMENFLTNNAKNAENKPSGQQKFVIMTIEKLLKNIPNISNGKFKIKARFNSIVEKLTVAENEYYLVVKVEDNSGNIAVRIHSDVVADLAECHPTALMSLKTGVMENNAEAQNKVLETIKRIKEKLIQLDNVVEVLINLKEKYPVIVNIMDKK